MKTIISSIIAFVLRIALWFRYRVTVKGLENLNAENLNKPGGVLFIPNHPSVFVDPVLVTISVWPGFPIRPMIVDYMYNIPGVNWVMRFMNALCIPSFGTASNSLKKRKSEAVTQAVIDGLKNGENFLIYPAGKTKDTAIEVIGGASAVHHIIQEAPEANVVLVRIKGLWGSMFSRAFLGYAPPMMPTLWQGIKIAFKNLIFFTPRRKVILEFVPAPPDFPYKASRLELNKYLENWYNQPDGLTPQKTEMPGDSFVLVSHSMWGEVYPKMQKELQDKGSTADLSKIPVEVQKKVIQKISQMTEIDPRRIQPEMSLASDLGLDSLDNAELIAFLQDDFDVNGVSSNQLKTVEQLMGLASRQISAKEEANHEAEKKYKNWRKPQTRQRCAIPEGNTIPEVFLNACALRPNESACVDLIAGSLTYSQMKMRVILLAEHIRNLPGEYVGILLPASVAATILILATQLAGKIPLMVNWTVGPRHLDSVLKLSNVDVILSSWSFLDRLDNVNLDPIEKKLLMMEDLRSQIRLTDKIEALFRSRLSTKTLLKIFNHQNVTGDDKAVLLFTSGTESMPKGVPLTHNNILSNQRASLQIVEVFNDDALFGLLPPFHAFGFTVSALLGVLGGMRTAFSPDPTDGKKLAKGVERWGITVLCAAPTFIKGIFKSGRPEQLKTIRLCVSGAEKAPPELFAMLEHIGQKNALTEGYGITECSPVLTMNRTGVEPKGVGQALPGVELMIVHQETLEPQPLGAQGLILARGPNIFSGYLNPGLSSPFVRIRDKEWYKTGDLGYLDELGRLTISGRLKRFIKVGPEMVSLASIEDALLKIALSKGWPTANDGPTLAVCAKEIPGEKPKIFLFTKFDTNVDEINKSLKESGFSNLVRISSVTHLEEIPLMGTGKINYRALESEHIQ